MRWLALFVLVLAPALAQAQEDEAEKLYRAMEKKILAAESLVMKFNAEISFDDKKLNEFSKPMRGTIYVAPGDKTRIEFDSELMGSILMLTNGEAIYQKVTFKMGDKVIEKVFDKPAKDEQSPKGKVLVGIIARLGAVPCVTEKKIRNLQDHAKVFPVKNFKLGVKEMAGKREAQVVHYQFEDTRDGQLTAATIWIDTKTQLPLKRVFVEKKDRFTETYSVFTVDSKLDGKLFEIPKKE